MEYKETPRFNVFDPKSASDMLEYLSQNGYAVIAEVATNLDEAKELFWNFVEQKRTKLKRNDVRTWNGDNWLPSPNNGILGEYGFAHSDFCWNSRILPGVKKTFEIIWGTDDLIVSYDGGNAFRPWKYNPLWITEGGWWHVDQNSLNRNHRRGKVCVQGLVTYYDATPDTGGLCVIPKSHLQHDEICARVPFAKVGIDFVPIEDDPILKNGGILVSAKAGDLIVWDSRTVHCNTPALTISEHFKNHPYDPDNPPNCTEAWDIIRLVSYVCMLPFSHATPEVIEQKKKAFIHHISTHHWPNNPIIFDKKSDNPVDISKCPKEILDLVGYRN